MAGNDPLMMSGACERAREWASLRLDDELSVLEEEILERHLDVCDACRRFEEGMRVSTVRIRTTPLEMPARQMPVPSRRGLVTRQRKWTAMVAAAALGLGALIGSLVERPGDAVPSQDPAQVSFLSRDANDLRDFSRTRLMTPLPTPATPRNPPEGVI
jgi:putative zinc finger protein